LSAGCIHVSVQVGKASPRTRIKICGITRPGDGIAAAECGADAIGIVFYERSSRTVDVAAAQAIVAALPPLVGVVGLFLDADPSRVRSVIAAVSIDLLQFHGDEPPEYCAAFGRRYIKAVPMKGDVDPVAYARRYGDAAGFLLDSHGPGGAGGTGERFDWRKVPAALGKPIVLAGGLNPSNVSDAVRAVSPFAVDVSSGVEASPGVKDRNKIASFISEVNRVQAR